jgi:hypothetical protein
LQVFGLRVCLVRSLASPPAPIRQRRFIVRLPIFRETPPIAIFTQTHSTPTGKSRRLLPGARRTLHTVNVDAPAWPGMLRRSSAMAMRSDDAHPDAAAFEWWISRAPGCKSQYWWASFMSFASWRRSGYPAPQPNPYPQKHLSRDFIPRLLYGSRKAGTERLRFPGRVGQAPTGAHGRQHR